MFYISSKSTETSRANKYESPSLNLSDGAFVYGELKTDRDERKNELSVLYSRSSATVKQFLQCLRFLNTTDCFHTERPQEAAQRVLYMGNIETARVAAHSLKTAGIALRWKGTVYPSVICCFHNGV